MSVTYTCNGIVKEFTIPDDEDFNSVTISFTDGANFSYNKHSLLFMENIFTARGCVCFKEILPAGTTVTINDEQSETQEQAIERLDETTAQIQEKQEMILAVEKLAFEDN